MKLGTKPVLVFDDNEFGYEDAKRACREYADLEHAARLNPFEPLPRSQAAPSEFEYFATDWNTIVVKWVRYNPGMSETNATPNDAFDVRTFAGYQQECAKWLNRALAGSCDMEEAREAIHVISQLREYAKKDGAEEAGAVAALERKVEFLAESLSRTLDILDRTLVQVGEVRSKVEDLDSAKVRHAKLIVQGRDRVAELAAVVQLIDEMGASCVQGLERIAVDHEMKLQAAGEALRQCGEAGLDLTKLVEGRTQGLRRRSENAEYRLRIAEDVLARIDQQVSKLVPQDHAYDFDGNGCRKCGGPTNALHPRLHTPNCNAARALLDGSGPYPPCDCEGVMPVQYPTPSEV